VWIGIISLFPKMFQIITTYGITGRASKNGLLNLQYWNPRKFSFNKYKSIDDRPYGGGSGMLMMGKPLQKAIHAAKDIAGKKVKVIYLSPQGRKLNNQNIKNLATLDKIILICGRYKGIDERLIKTEIDEELSIGDYVISGGELAAMVLIDSVSRFIPGVLGCKYTINEDSFSNGLLDCPHYTRPKIFSGIEVPSVLLSGHHKKIYRWRLKQSLGRTLKRRPDLLEKLNLSDEQKFLLTEFKYENMFL